MPKKSDDQTDTSNTDAAKGSKDAAQEAMDATGVSANDIVKASTEGGEHGGPAASADDTEIRFKSLEMRMDAMERLLGNIYEQHGEAVRRLNVFFDKLKNQAPPVSNNFVRRDF